MDGSDNFHPAAMKTATNVDTQTSDVGKRKPFGTEGMKMERLTKFLQDLSSVTKVMMQPTNPL